jgi:hypothetical protein
MKKAWFVFVLNISIIIAGCIQNADENELKEFTIGVQNFSDKEENAKIVIENIKQNEMLNLSLQVQPNKYKSTSIMCEEGEYFILIQVDENRHMEYSLTIDEYPNGVNFDIYSEEIKLTPVPIP